MAKDYRIKYSFIESELKNNFKYNENCYDAVIIEKKIKSINAKIKKLYDLYIERKSDNLLDMIPTYELMQKAYPKKNIHIIGLAKGYEEGINLIQEIIQEVYDATGAFNIRDYLNLKGEK